MRLKISYLTTFGCLLIFLVAIPAIDLFAGAIYSGPNVQITDTDLDNDDAEEPSIAVVGNTIYAVWQDERDDGPQDTNGAVYFSKSTDGGQTWGPNVRVTDPTYDKWADDPEIAVQPDGTIWVVWFQLYRENSNKVNDIRFAISTDGGQTFGDRAAVVNGLDSDETLWRPDIEADANGVYILYRYYSCASPCNSSSQEGYTISLKAIDTVNISVETTMVSDTLYDGRFTGFGLDDGPKVDLALNNGLLCGAWEDDRNQAIYGACSQDNGVTFGSNFAISVPNSVNPAIALGPTGTLYATYSLANDNQNNIWLRHSTDSGQSWSTPIQLTNQTTNDIESWDLSVDSAGQLLLTWVVESGISATDLYLSTSIDDGGNWSTVQVEDGQGRFPNTADQTDPIVVTNNISGNDYAYVAWSDDRNSNDQIWFSRFLLDNTPPSAPINVVAEAAAGAIQLSWEAGGTSSDIDGYHVYRATSSGGPFIRINPRLVQRSAYVDPELNPGTTYYYQIAAVDPTGNVGPRSATVNAAAATNNNTSAFGTVAYQSGSNIQLRDLSSNQESSITNGQSPKFSPNGDGFYHIQGDSIWRRTPTGSSPAVYRTFGNSAQNIQLLEFDLGSTGEVGVIQSRQFASAGPTPLCVVTEAMAYSPQNQVDYVDEFIYGSEVAMSADGQWLAFRATGFCNAAAAGVYSPPRFCIANITSNTENCIDGADYRDPDFGPSGNTVVFAAALTGQNELWKADIKNDGSLTNYVQLTNGGSNTPSRNPAWSTDGNWIVYQRDIDPSGGENWHLHIVRSDGVANRSLGIAGEDPAWNGGGDSPPILGLNPEAFLPLLTR